jgi:hypothetical protein
MKTNFLLFLVLLSFCMGCAGNLGLQKKADGALPKVGLKVEVTSEKQKEFADSLATMLAQRLVMWAEERKDFVFEPAAENPDYVMKCRISKVVIVPFDRQQSLKSKRDNIDRKYDAINDSIDASYKPMTTAQKVAANIAVNVIANVLTLPLGIVSVSVVEDKGPQHVETSEDDQKSYDSTFIRASFAFYATFVKSDGKSLWEMKRQEKFLLNEMSSEQEQKKILLRNAMLYMEDKFPLFRQKK